MCLKAIRVRMMEIVDLTEDRLDAFLCCLKTEDTTFAGGVPRKRQWYRRFRDRGVRVKLAIDDDGVAAGMIQYAPAVLSPSIEGEEGTWVIDCIWVHGYRTGIGDRRGRGMGPALLAAAEDDVRVLGGRGIIAWGLREREWMNAPWFEDHGYRRVQERGAIALVFKSLEEGVGEPRWVERRRIPPRLPGKVRVSSFLSGWCTSMNLIHEWARQAAEELGDPVVFETHDVTDPAVVAEFGIGGGVFVDGDRLPIDGTETYEKVRAFIADHLPR